MGCSQLQLTRINGVKYGTSNWLAVTSPPHLTQGVPPEIHVLHGVNAGYKLEDWLQKPRREHSSSGYARPTHCLCCHSGYSVRRIVNIQMLESWCDRVCCYGMFFLHIDHIVGGSPFCDAVAVAYYIVGVGEGTISWCGQSKLHNGPISWILGTSTFPPGLGVNGVRVVFELSELKSLSLVNGEKKSCSAIL